VDDHARRSLNGDKRLEELAAIEHERWSHWQTYMHGQCEPRADGSLVIPADLVSKWSAQAATACANLTDDERDCDREQVRRYLPVIERALD
jgi:hypothetical protein